MKQRTSFLTRCLALVLALMMLVSNANLGVTLKAFAVENGESISVGEVIINAYDLTEAEQNLLRSGYLVSDTIEFSYPADDGLVSIDSEAQTVFAQSYKDWVPTVAQIVAKGKVFETIKIVNGEAGYTYTGNAFSAQVTYVLNADIAKADQERLLNAAAYLKQGVANLETVNDQSTGLQALEMQEVRDGLQALTEYVTDESAKEMIRDLESEMNGNGGKLKLSTMIVDAKKQTKTGYILTEGTAMQAEVVELHGKVEKLHQVILDTIEMLNMFGAFVDPTGELLAKFNMLEPIIGNLKNGLAAVAEDPWTAANLGDKLVYADANYAVLDLLVAALERTTSNEVSEGALQVASTKLSANLSMFNVNVVVSLAAVEDKVGSAAVLPVGSKNETVTLNAGASAEEIRAAIDVMGLASDIVGWADVYAADHFKSVESELPATLEQDITFTVDFMPNTYTLTTNFAGEQAVPYGFKMELPVSADEDKSFDYTVNGVAAAQGDVITITGDTEVKQISGKAYISSNLYAMIADNYAMADKDGNELVKAILTSGALKGNEVINYRAPESNDVDLTLENKTLTANPYDASYENLSWVGYSHDDGLFGSESAVEWTKSSAKVIYRLILNTPVEEVKAILALPATLRAEAVEQKAALDRLNGYYDDLGSLTQFVIGFLGNTVDTIQLNDDAAKNAALKVQLKEIFTAMNENCYKSGNTLDLHVDLTGYRASGLADFYKNNEAYITHLADLSAYMTQMLAEDPANNLTKEDKIGALEALLKAAAPEKVYLAAKLSTMEQSLAEISADLKAPNAVIDTESKSLTSLVNLLQAEGETVVAEEVSYVYVDSSEMTVVSDDMVFATVTVQLVDATGNPTKKIDIDTEAIWIGDSYDFVALEEKVNAAIEATVGRDAYFYACVAEGSIDDLKGAQTESKKVVYTYSIKNFTVKISGQADQIINVNDLVVELPANEKEGFENRYTINGKDGITAATYEFSKQDLKDLFDENGEYTITCKVVDLAEEKLNELLKPTKPTEPKPTEPKPTEPVDPEKPTEPTEPEQPTEPEEEEVVSGWTGVWDENGNLTGMVGNAATADIMSLFTDLVSVYQASYIEMNGEILMDKSGKVHIQTLINTILADDEFGSEKIIEVANNNGGVILECKMDFHPWGMSKVVDCTINLLDAPAELKQAAGYMEMVKDYVSFETTDSPYANAGSTESNRVMQVNVTLPDKIYEVYVAGLLAGSELDVKDVNTMDTEVAIRVFYDYFDAILNSDANTTTFTNTLQMLHIDKDLTGYESRYQQIKSLMLAEDAQLVLNSEKDDSIFDVYAALMGDQIQPLMNLIGLSIPDLYKGMIYEYDNADARIEISAVLTLTNTLDRIEAFIVDPVRDGLNTEGGLSKEGALNILRSVKNKIAYSNDFVADSAEIVGPAAVVLMDDIYGDITFNHITVIDLNGKTINGNLVANDNVLILDSSMDSTKCGGVTGNVSGELTIISGNYNADVSAYVMDGYKQDGTAVRNALYTIKTDDKGNLTVEVNTDVMYDECVNGYVPSMSALAVEIALDITMNYYASAGLSADGQEIYGFNFRDLIDVVGSGTPFADAINMVLGCIDAPGFSNLVNNILENLLDFGGNADAIENNEPTVSHSFSTAAIELNIEYVADGDYITIGAYPDYTKGKTFDLDIIFVGENRMKMVKLARGMDSINEFAEASLNLEQPVYRDRTLWLAGTAITHSRWDLTVNEDYVTALILVLAKGVPANQEALLTALDSGDQVALKAEFDKLNIDDFCNALKAVSKEYNFNQAIKNMLEKAPYVDIAKRLLAKLDLDNTDKWDHAFRVVQSGVDKVLDYLRDAGITAKTVGGLDKDNDGYYGGAVDGTINGDVNYRGFGLDVYAFADCSLFVKLFDLTVEEPTDPDCLWGDANHDGEVNSKDATLVLQYSAGTLKEGTFFCELRTDVNGDGDINSKDATLILQHSAGIIDIFPVEE